MYSVLDQPSRICARDPGREGEYDTGAAEQAEGQLRRSSYLALRNISCECRDGTLILRGCLPSYYLKQQAQAAVARVEGVGPITNEIEVIVPSRRG